MEHEIVDDELRLLAHVTQVLAERPYIAPPKETDLVTELVRLRDEIPKAKEEDRGSLMDQYHQNVSLLEQIRASRDKPQVDPDCPYFAHLRLTEDGRARDLCLGKATRIEAGIRIVDWRNAPISRIFYRYQQGDDYEEELGGKMVQGEVTARRTVTIASGKLDRIEAPEGVFHYDAATNTWTRKDREGLRLRGGEGAALRAHAAGEGLHRRLGTDLDGSRRRQDKRLPDIAGLIDADQFALITRPSTGFVVVRGSAGSGKTTVALHRIAWLGYDDPQINSPRTLFVVFSPALRDYVGHVLPALGVPNATISTFRHWAVEQRRRHFPSLPRAVRDDTPAAVLRLKQHPVMLTALEEQVKRAVGPATAEQAVDDWASVLVQPDVLRPILDEQAHGAFTDVEIDRITTWCRERHEEFVAWQEGDKEARPELDPEDDALLLRAWQLRVGPLRAKGGLPLRYRHIAIDEVQDFSPLEVRVLLGCLDERQSITLAGDTQQHVMRDSGFTSWEGFFRHLGVEGTSVDTLRISLPVQPRGHAVRPRRCSAICAKKTRSPTVARSGPPVELFPFTDHGAIVAFLADVLDRAAPRGAARERRDPVPRRRRQRAIYDGARTTPTCPGCGSSRAATFTFAPGVEVTEIEQVKGLEFDYVILVDVTAARFPDTPSSRRLLHVGATRAVHQLWVTTVGTASSIVREAIAEIGTG